MPPRPTTAPDGRDRVGREQRDLAGGAERAEAEAAAGGHAEPQLVEEAEPHLRVGEDHLEVAARDVLEELHVDVVFLDLRRHGRAGALDELLGLLAA